MSLDAPLVNEGAKEEERHQHSSFSYLVDYKFHFQYVLLVCCDRLFTNLNVNYCVPASRQAEHGTAKIT